MNFKKSIDVEIGRAFTDAAVDPSRWARAMDIVCEVTGAYGAGLFPIVGRLPAVPISGSLQPAFDTYIREGWVERDERYRAWPVIARRGVATDLDFVDVDAIARHPYYQDFLGRHGLRWFAGVKVGDGEDQWCLSIQRTIEQGPFSADELKVFARLSARLSVAAALARAVGFARVEAATAALEASGSAAILLSRRGEVVQVNPSAERLLGPDLQITHGRVASWDAEATAAFDRALHALLWSARETISLPPVLLPRRAGRPVLAYPTRLAGISADALAPCQIVVVLVDLAARDTPSESDLRTAFRFTAAEARLAACLCDGDVAIDVAAERLGIAYETARTQLKSIFAKTKTHRQSELVRILARFLNRE